MESELKTNDDMFDWVKARRECRLSVQFGLLKHYIKKQTEDRQLYEEENHGTGGSVSFSFNPMGSSEFSICSSVENGGVEDISFKMKESSVIVKKDNDVLLEAVVALNDEGECRFKILGDDGEFLCWHIAKRVLEDLFFGRKNDGK